MQVGVDAQTPEAVRSATCQVTPQSRAVTVPHDDKVFTVTFKHIGLGGGSIAVKGKQTNLVQSLPEVVEDHWGYFADDPNYKAWMTDPHYHVVISLAKGRKLDKKRRRSSASGHER